MVFNYFLFQILNCKCNYCFKLWKLIFKMSVFEYVLLNYRWIFICFYLLPVSVFCDICSVLKNWLTFKIYSSPKQHESKIKNIQKQIQQWIKSGQKVQICTSRTGSHSGSERPNYKSTLYNIQMNLLDILEINGDEKIVKVQPFVTMGQLTSTLLPLGWTIPVLPGISDLTVGGLILGTGLDSSSHKYGLFYNSCISYEMILSDGSLVKCSRDENPDLFYAVPWSYGTLGLLTAIEIKLIPAHKYVKLEYKALHNKSVAVTKFIEECGNKNNDFVEGLLYNENQCIIIKGKMVDQIEPIKLNEIGKWYKPWFFQHVKNYFVKGFGVEYISLKDYYYRHTRSTYWELQDLIPFGNNILFRMFLGWAVPPKLSFFKLTQAELVKKLYKDQPIMLDLMVPADKLQLAIDTFDEKLGVYPIWLCPVQLNNSQGFVHSRKSEELYINAGIYGIPKAFGFHPQKSLRETENFIRGIKGFKMLYGDIYMNEDEFRQQFDHTLYDRMRNKLKCEKAFPTIFEKINLMKNENFSNKKFKDCL